MQQAILTVDLGFGDAGKGSIVDFLTRQHEAHTVIRYNGGAQAGHRVVVPHLPAPSPERKQPHSGEGEDRLEVLSPLNFEGGETANQIQIGRRSVTPPLLTGALSGQERGPGGEASHVFAQFGSGTLAGANTHLSRFMLLDPLAMQQEEEHLRLLGINDAFARTTIDAQALVITPFQRAVNRLSELARGDGRHGSCGMGIGETMRDALIYGDKVLRAGDLINADRLWHKLAFLHSVNQAKIRDLRSSLPETEQVVKELALFTAPNWADWLIEAYQDFADQAQIVGSHYLQTILNRSGTVVFEGAQGVLLDEWLGFHPHTTWSTTTLANADFLLREANYIGNVTRIGITRAYATRHGAGPFVSEEATLAEKLGDASNHFGEWQRGFRLGWLDLVLLRYALEVTGPLDMLAVTCLDRLAELSEIKVCRSYACGGATIKRLAPSPTPRNLDYQSGLTELLLRCQPLLTTVTDENALLKLLQDELGVSVGLRSYGAGADRKCISPIEIGVGEPEG